MAIPLSRPPVDDEIKQAVVKAVESGQYILGPECKAFEREFAAYNGAKHAVLTTSATAALWLTIKAFGAKGGDEILVPAHTAFPTIEAICFAGVTPVFVDIDDTYTVDVKDAAAKVTPRTVGFIPVHLYGHPANLTDIQELCAKHKLWLLEDCAQAHGAAWQGKKVGSFGRAGVFSFYPSKNLTVMGDGGLLVTDDDEVAARCRRLRDHGRQSKDIHLEVGFNLRFNDIQAAVGRVLLRRLDAMNDERRRLAARYAGGLAGLPLVLPSEAPGARHVYHLYVVATSGRDQLAAFLKDKGIATGIHYPVPCHQQPAVEYLKPGPLEHTERIVKQILTLPISAGHRESEIDEVVAAVRAFFKK
ncbi:MAG TPA: DegT/DnrJ/EryC1/StrS family aminotransferase [Candidatus Acidoferrales bacterium]|nr:DegT/DnrJ/EryC1/StrS family aminotransferase [Candidatus Acidoferrales bacterium]